MENNNNSNDLQFIMDEVASITAKLRSRYIMPEHILYAMTRKIEFCQIFETFGGSIELLIKDLDEFFQKNDEKMKEDGLMETTEDCRIVFERAEVQARLSGRDQIEISHLFSAILSLEDSFAAYYILKQPVDLVELIGEMSRMSLREDEKYQDYDDMYDEDEEIAFSSEEGWTFSDTKPSAKANKWKEYVECISDMCMERGPLIGREKEMERTVQILSRMEKNNVLHVGEPGVGKTALIYGLAQRIEKGQVPEILKESKIYSMEMGSMVAGTQYRGEFEQRVKYVMEGLKTLDRPILYLDEIHNIVGAGSTSDGSLDMSNMLKPYLTDGKIKFVGATTYEEYKKHITTSKSLLRRFQKVDIEEPSKEEAVEILKGLKTRYEKFHGVKYGKGVLEYAVEVSAKFVNERFLPDKAIDLIDEAGAYRKIHPLEQKTQSVNKDLIDDVLSLTCNVPKQRVERNDIEELAVLEEKLSKQVFGQSEAIKEVSNAIKFSRAGLNEENKPVASFLFVGPTGVGKTETAKSLANEMGIHFIRFDMSEYTEKHAVAKLIGSPAGYVGYEDGGLLTEEVRKHPYSVLLLDEIEKAHSDIFNILLQVMDYATLTDNRGRKADFRNVVLIMTSNAGASSVGKNVIGFGGGKLDDTAINEAVKNTFQPEFRNRLSKIVLFHSMDDEMAMHITEKKIESLKKQMTAKKIQLTVEQDAMEYVKNRGITNEYGAREIDRVIAANIKPLLVEQILFGKLKKGGKCKIEKDKKENKLHLKV